MEKERGRKGQIRKKLKEYGTTSRKIRGQDGKVIHRTRHAPTARVIKKQDHVTDEEWKKRKKKTPVEKKEPKNYRDGGEGFIKWAEDYIYVSIYPKGSDVSVWIPLKDLPEDIDPVTGKSYRQMWEAQKDICREALRMENGKFVYRLIVFCWMRGEGKSLLACFIQLWKFFNWPKQQIMLGANSKDQVKFVHFDIMRDLIINSPPLLRMVGGKKNIQEKEIRLKDKLGNVRSIIRSISSFSGIVSNITGYTFSEIFDMKNPKFFVQLDGSIRNIPNALGVIDSTVSTKNHILYKLFSGYRSGKLKTVFFSYRFSRNGVQADYWNPNMSDEQLGDYKTKFPLGEFERYFLNQWSAGRVQVFSDETVEETYYIGCNKTMFAHKILARKLARKKECLENIKRQKEWEKKSGLYDGVRRVAYGVSDMAGIIEKEMQDVIPVKQYYTLEDNWGSTRIAQIEELNKLGDVLETNWSILAGTDFADPMAIHTSARTILTVIAKGLPGSRLNPFLTSVSELEPKYVYFLLCFFNAPNHDVNSIKEMLRKCKSEYGGIDIFCSERYGAWDMPSWCEDNDIAIELVHPNYDRQRDAFKEFFTVMDEGRFKAPPVPVAGKTGQDVLREELSIFDHREKMPGSPGWFGSPEKGEKNGIQDDSVYAIAWTIYGGRNLGVMDFRKRTGDMDFGNFVPNKEVLGNY